jgi:hypothetical protein
MLAYGVDTSSPPLVPSPPLSCDNRRRCQKQPAGDGRGTTVGMRELAINASAEQLALGGFVVAASLAIIGAGVRVLLRLLDREDPEI